MDFLQAYYLVCPVVQMISFLAFLHGARKIPLYSVVILPLLFSALSMPIYIIICIYTMYHYIFDYKLERYKQ